MLLPCGNPACEEKWFLLADAAPRCPWCGWEQREPAPVLEFYYSPGGRKGQYRPEGRRLATYDQQRLYRWHAFRNIHPGEGVDAQVMAFVVRRQGQWLLVNRALNGLTSPGGQAVAIGQACELHDGDEVLLSQEEHGRLVTVTMVP